MPVLTERQPAEFDRTPAQEAERYKGEVGILVQACGVL